MTTSFELGKPPIVKSFDNYLTDLARVRLNHKLMKSTSAAIASASEVTKAKEAALKRANELKLRKEENAGERGGEVTNQKMDGSITNDRDKKPIEKREGISLSLSLFLSHT